MEFGERTGMAAKKGEGEEGKEKDEKQEEEEAMKEMMAETKSKKKIDTKMFKNILSMKQDELSNAAAEYQEMRERAARSIHRSNCKRYFFTANHCLKVEIKA